METSQTKQINEAYSKDELVSTFRTLGLHEGSVVEVHSAMHYFDYVIGGARTIVDALLEVVGKSGTILMAKHTIDNSEPSSWNNPPINVELWDKVRENMPAYNPKLSDIRFMSKVTENFCLRDGVVFSNHPGYAYVAYGKYAKFLCNRQSFHFPLSFESAAAGLYELKGDVLLIGVDFDRCTCMHFAEYLSDARPIVVRGASVNENGEKVWKQYLDLDIDSSCFNEIGKLMIRKNMVRSTMLHDCKIQLFKANDAIDTAAHYFDRTVVYDLYR